LAFVLVANKDTEKKSFAHMFVRDQPENKLLVCLE